MAAWFEDYPELERWELEQFGERQLQALVDEGERRHGQLVIHSAISFRGAELPIVVRYPSEYPELPPLIYAAPGLLERHQQPFDGNFCLLENPLDDWNAAEWSAADMICERLTALLVDSEAGPDAVRAAEAPMPEPYTAHFHYPLGPTVLMSEGLASPTGSEGRVKLRLFDPGALRLVVESVDNKMGGPHVLDSFHNQGQVEAKWRRVTELPPGPDAATVLAWLRRTQPDLLPAPLPLKLRNSPRLRQPQLMLAAFVFSEEREQVGSVSDGWLFVGIHQDQPVLFHHQLISPEQQQRRAPASAPLAKKAALILGAGTLGGHIGVELARAGTGAVAFADHDRYEFGNSVRHVLPIDALGLGKAEACALAARRANPFCRATAQPLLLGATRFDVPPLDELRRLVAHADIVVEATGSQQLATLACRIAREEGVPTIVCGMTNGYWGGEVARIAPRETCCYVCFAHDQRAGVWAAPDEGPEPLVAAQGCSHPAVVGAGFDALEIAAIATRLTVQTLLRGDGYPDSGWDHAAISFRRDSADTERPRMVTERMPAKDGCSICSGAVGYAA